MVGKKIRAYRELGDTVKNNQLNCPVLMLEQSENMNWEYEIPNQISQKEQQLLSD